MHFFISAGSLFNIAAKIRFTFILFLEGLRVQRPRPTRLSSHSAGQSTRTRGLVRNDVPLSSRGFLTRHPFDNTRVKEFPSRDNRCADTSWPFLARLS